MGLPKQQYRNRVLAALPKAEIDRFTPYLLTLLSLVEAEATLTEKGQNYLTLAKQEVQRISKIAHGTPDLELTSWSCQRGKWVQP
jgi:hypothetical protein